MSARFFCSPVGIIVLAIPIHLGLAVTTDLSPDEAYYAVASRLAADWLRPIVDHPPFVCWLLRPLAGLSWLPVELQVRLPVVLLSAALSLLAARLAGRHARTSLEPQSQATAERIAAFLTTWLLLPAAGGFLMTPDVPASLGLLVALAWGSTPRPRAWWTVAASAATAVGCLSKVSVVPAAMAAFWGSLTLDRPFSAVLSNRRRTRLEYGTRLLWLVGPAVVTPLLLQSLAFQKAHAFVPVVSADLPQRTVAVIASLGSLVLLFSPPIVWLGLREVGKMAPVYGTTLGLFTALVLASAATRGVPAEPNWWLPAALPLVIGGAVAVSRLPARSLKTVLVVAVAPTAAVMAHAVHPLLPLPSRLDPTARIHGWRSGPTVAVDAPGIGRYGRAAERCIYDGDCAEIMLHINDMSPTR